MDDKRKPLWCPTLINKPRSSLVPPRREPFSLERRVNVPFTNMYFDSFYGPGTELKYAHSYQQPVGLSEHVLKVPLMGLFSRGELERLNRGAYLLRNIRVAVWEMVVSSSTDSPFLKAKLGFKHYVSNYLHAPGRPGLTSLTSGFCSVMPCDASEQKEKQQVDLHDVWSFKRAAFVVAGGPQQHDATLQVALCCCHSQQDCTCFADGADPFLGPPHGLFLCIKRSGPRDCFEKFTGAHYWFDKMRFYQMFWFTSQIFSENLDLHRYLWSSDERFLFESVFGFFRASFDLTFNFEPFSFS
jgi:hypothetical protein